MPAIHIRDVPADVLTALKERASRAGRSMQKEVLAILVRAAQDPLPPQDLPPIELATTRAGGRQSFDRETMYDDAAG